MISLETYVEETLLNEENRIPVFSLEKKVEGWNLEALVEEIYNGPNYYSFNK